MKKFLLFAVIVIVSAGLGTTTYIYSKLNEKYTGPTKHFTIEPGQGFGKINYKLKKEFIINDARFFHHYTKYNNALNKFKAGTYEIKTGMNVAEVLETLTNGTPILTKITISEGKNIYEIAKELERKEITTYDEFLKACRDQQIIASLNIKAPSLEGYLFPETYKFAKKTNAKKVVQTMLQQFKNKTAELNFSHDLLSKHEIIILASIVEKETGAAWERPTIAGVYLNRLRKPMRLQADPTTIYGIWETYNGNLRKKHLLQKTDYNTYKINGLPLGPIANPSLEAIKAVLEPKEHKFLYFVSKNDGTHIFTPTYKEHLKAVQFWQKNIRNRKGKSWRDLKQKK